MTNKVATESSLSKTRNPVVVQYLLFVFFSNFSTMLYFLTTFLQQGGLSLGQVSLLLLCYQASKFVFEIPTGYMGDRFGRKASGLAGLGGLVVYLVMLLVVRDFVWLIPAFILRGIALSCVSGSIESLFVDSIEESELIRYNTWDRMAFFGSYALSVILGGLLAGQQLMVFGIICDLIAILLAIIATSLIRELRHPNSNEMQEKQSLSAIKQMLKTRPILVAGLLIDLAQAFTFVAFEDFYIIILRDMGLSPFLAGLSLALQLLIAAGLGLFTSRILRTVNTKQFFMITSIIKLPFTALILLSAIPVMFVPLIYIGESILGTLSGAIRYRAFQEACPSELRNTCISLQSQMISCAALLFYGISAMALEFVTLPQLLLMALGVTACIYVPAVFRMSKAVHSSWE
ncbi:MFS transporter [Collinsella sp. zg1085]|uniref:MFS transporter n=1 Tax=Collinsella sp. zg1085 TaxID=2844380 RepID=UPI001C0DF4E9|nr:MFS transporter [Collinsella sp. zg1085]QWT17349.1 MFS transporter [Collinsella sp. zg1085]